MKKLSLFLIFTFSFSAFAKPLTQQQIQQELKVIQKYRSLHKHKTFSEKKAHPALLEQKIGDDRPAVSGLSHSEAKKRKLMVDNIQYNISLDIIKAQSRESFDGVVTITFDYTPFDKHWPLTIDFTGGSVDKIFINESRQKLAYNGFFISIPPSKLLTGKNILEIHYSQKYDVRNEEQEGLHKIVEKFEGNENTYLYTQFEVYAANKMFPCFDQPDLKAKYQIDVKAPKDWEVISSTKQTKIENLRKSNHWFFPLTNKQFSTYVFSLHAGPYKKWETTNYDGRVGLRLFARKSQAKTVATQAELWFKITKEGFRFYESYFGIPYPFEKYDQLIVNEFAAGAMENVGAVTFQEDSFVISANDSDSEVKWRYAAVVILHEMTHMWFGNLATMKWWGDLWLNESFATYFPLLAMKHGSSVFKDLNDAYFYLWEKDSAYDADDGSEEPVVNNIPSTQETGSNLFDAITYNKGGSVLKQLSYYVGAGNFQEGVKRYLNDYSYTNAVTENFNQSFAQGSGQYSITPWLVEWFAKPGHNTVEVFVDCYEGKLSKLLLTQTKGTGPVLRTHKTEIATFKKNATNQWSVLSPAKDIVYSGEETDVTAFNGTACPDFVYVNLNDNDFVKIKLDKNSARNLDLFKKAILDLDLDPVNSVIMNGTMSK
ncbi:MAG: hypothetical protein JNM93_06895 [Bacteriovoracaceae bacterium]|nr:hypothetical protein [Bacteriovoracaceae bacterium]